MKIAGDGLKVVLIVLLSAIGGVIVLWGTSVYTPDARPLGLFNAASLAFVACLMLSTTFLRVDKLWQKIVITLFGLFGIFYPVFGLPALDHLVSAALASTPEPGVGTRVILGLLAGITFVVGTLTICVVVALGRVSPRQ